MHINLLLGDIQLKWYDILNTVGNAAFFLFILCHIKQKGQFLSLFFVRIQNFFKNRPTSNPLLRFLQGPYLWAIIELYLLYWLYSQGGFFAPIFSNTFDTGANYFGLLIFSPLILLVSYWVLGISPRRQADFLAPAFPLALIFYKIGCFCAGCCNGIECKIGFYNHNTSAVEFPVQLVEAGCAVLIFIILLLCRKKAKPGTLIPLHIILYCSLRFCSEFLRHEDNVFGPLKSYHLLCIISFVVGLVEYILIFRFGDELENFILTKNLPALISKLIIKIKPQKKRKHHTKK